MWIRSQDKKLLRNCNNIICSYRNPGQIISDVGYYEPDSDSYVILGEYKTTSRAIAVLDEIEIQINEIEFEKLKALSGNMDWSAFMDSKSAVYQMPEK